MRTCMFIIIYVMLIFICDILDKKGWSDKMADILAVILSFIIAIVVILFIFIPFITIGIAAMIIMAIVAFVVFVLSVIIDFCNKIINSVKKLFKKIFNLRKI